MKGQLLIIVTILIVVESFKVQEQKQEKSSKGSKECKIVSNLTLICDQTAVGQNCQNENFLLSVLSSGASEVRVCHKSDGLSPVPTRIEVRPEIQFHPNLAENVFFVSAHICFIPDKNETRICNAINDDASADRISCKDREALKQHLINGERKIRACVREPNHIRDVYTDVSLFIIVELQTELKQQQKKN